MTAVATNDAFDAAAQLVRAAVPGLAASVESSSLRGARVSVAAGRSDTLDRLRLGSVRAVMALGAFDGVHIGHRALVGDAAADAAARGVICVAVTFDPDPADVLVGPVAGTRLLEPADRAALLVEAGADAVITLPFTKQLAARSYQEFLAEVVADFVDVVALHVGSDFRVGNAGAGTLDRLAAYGEDHGFVAHGHRLVERDGAPVSATRIRALLGAGDVAEAAELLGRHHFVRGVVEHGRGEGSSFGFPTANIRMDMLACMPVAGVYGAYAVVGDANEAPMAYAAAVNVGTPPTFTSASDPAFLEANLIGYEGDLYGRSVSIVFCHHIRPTHVFESLKELEQTVYENIYWVKERMGARGVPLA